MIFIPKEAILNMQIEAFEDRIKFDLEIIIIPGLVEPHLFVPGAVVQIEDQHSKSFHTFTIERGSFKKESFSINRELDRIEISGSIKGAVNTGSSLYKANRPNAMRRVYTPDELHDEYEFEQDEQKMLEDIEEEKNKSRSFDNVDDLRSWLKKGMK